MIRDKKIGVLKLNTRFPRLIGDIGNPQSFNYPVVYETVTTATPETVVTGSELPASLKKDIMSGAMNLMRHEVDIITTSCGFLSTMQHELATSCRIPVITSSLTLLNLLSLVHGGSQHIAVLTFDANNLATEHLNGNTPGAIEGLNEHDSLRQTIANDEITLDQDQAQQEVLAACNRLLDGTKHLKAIVLECTNLPPYKNAIRLHTGLAVFDIVDAVEWLLNSQPSAAPDS